MHRDRDRVGSGGVLHVRYTAGVDGELNFSLRGTLFGVGASAVGTFYTIYLKYYLSHVVEDSWLLSFYTNFNSCLILPLLCLVGDWRVADVQVNGEVPVVWQHRAELNAAFFFWIYLCRR